MKDKNNFDKMRPKEIYEKALDLRKSSGESFYDEHSLDFVETGCPSCGSVGNVSLVKFKYSHRLCSKCLTMWCTPRPTEQLLSKYYQNSEATKYWTQLLISTDVERKAIQYEPRVKNIINILKSGEEVPRGLAVDLGAGSGAFALALKREGFFSEVLAVDFDADCVRACEGTGVATMVGSVENLDDDSVSLLTMNDMVEHLFCPKSFLEECFRKLKVGGHISIACPNGEGFDFKIMNEKTLNITPPEHLNYFNPRSLSDLLCGIGFEVTSCETPGLLDVDIVLNAYRNGSICLKNHKYLKEIFDSGQDLVLSNFQDFLKTNKLSSHMMIVARKVTLCTK